MPCLSVPYAKINVNHTCGFYSTTPFGFTFLSKPLLSWGSRAETQLLAASSLSFLINCVYQKVQSGMLGLPLLEAAPVVLGNKQSPIVSSEKLQASEEMGIRIGDWELGIRDWGLGLGTGIGD